MPLTVTAVVVTTCFTINKKKYKKLPKYKQEWSRLKEQINHKISNSIRIGSNSKMNSCDNLPSLSSCYDSHHYLDAVFCREGNHMLTTITGQRQKSVSAHRHRCRSCSNSAHMTERHSVCSSSTKRITKDNSRHWKRLPCCTGSNRT